MRLLPLIPKLMPLLSEKIIVPVDTLCVPALMPKGVSAGNEAEAVTRLLPLIPNVTLFEFEKTRVPVDTDCVPADTPKGVSAGTVTVAVTVCPFTPKLTLLEFEKMTVPSDAVFAPAEIKPVLPAAPAPPEIEIVIDPALVDPLRVMFGPPAKTSRPVTTPVSARVLPPVELPTESCAGTVGTV